MSEVKLPNKVLQIRTEDFRAIPGNPWVYWLREELFLLFKTYPSLGEYAQSRNGMTTGSNDRFLRLWWEVGTNLISRYCQNRESAFEIKMKWFPYMKGGPRKKWYGNQEFVINWFNDGIELKNTSGVVLRNQDYYFLESVTWTLLSSKGLGVRWRPPGFIFDVNGMSCFPPINLLWFTLAILNSDLGDYILRIINPTIAFQEGDISKLPFHYPEISSTKKINFYVYVCIRLSMKFAINDETTYDFCAPTNLSDTFWQQNVIMQMDSLEEKINNEIFTLYKITEDAQKSIKEELFGNNQLDDSFQKNEVEEEIVKNLQTDGLDNSVFWISFAVGIILYRFFIGFSKNIGSAIYHPSNFTIGSLPEPSEEEFNELVGNPSEFAYIDEQGGRHVFSKEVEQALKKLTVPDGITVFDPNHPRDLPTLVNKALELMLGQAQSQEVIQQAAGGDLRKFLEKDFFTQHHIKQYRKRPVYWPIQSSKRSYGFVLFHEKIDRNTFFALQQEPYLATKRRAVQFELEDLSKKALTMQGSPRKEIEKRIDELRQLGEELSQFAKDLEEITSGGYVPEPDWIDDGVILRMAPLWKVIPLWKNEPKKYWEALSEGKYDWSHIALKYWPKRVKQACKKNKSYAIAHGHEEWYTGEK